MSLPEQIVCGAIAAISPSGALAEIAVQNTELDRLLDEFDADEKAIQLLRAPSLTERLEDDFARCVPALANAAIPLEAWAIPLLSSFVPVPGGALIVSLGLTVACKVAILALKAWAEKRNKKNN